MCYPCIQKRQYYLLTTSKLIFLYWLKIPSLLYANLLCILDYIELLFYFTVLSFCYYNYNLVIYFNIWFNEISLYGFLNIWNWFIWKLISPLIVLISLQCIEKMISLYFSAAITDIYQNTYVHVSVSDLSLLYYWSIVYPCARTTSF